MPLGGPKQRALLAVLLLNANQVVSNDRLIDELWGEQPPRTAPAYLQNCISKLRKALGPEAVETRQPGYVLQVKEDAVDAWRFERLVREAVGLPATERAAVLRDALALWQGSALADFLFEPFAQAEIARLEELRLGALEDRIEAELELGLHAGLAGELEAFAVRHPSRERLRELQMVALYRAGRQTDALRVYQDARIALIEELGIEPGERLRALEQMILAHDPALDLHIAAPAARLVPARKARKTVAVLLARLEQPAGLDPEVAEAAAAKQLADAAGVVERHGGKLQQLLGDEVVATFGVVHVHEDDALRALRAGRELREALERDGLGVRIGVESGAMLVGDGAPGLTGSAVAVARRLEGLAEVGEILLGPNALRLAAGAIEVVSPASGVYRLLRIVEGSPAVARRFGAPIVGRHDELARLHAALDDAVEGSRCVRMVVVGEPGKGKTRLVAELLGSLGEGVQALIGSCVPYGEGVTYLPLTAALGELMGTGDTRPRIAALLEGEEDSVLVADRLVGALSAVGTPAASSEVAWAFRRLFETIAGERPVVLALDDVHWAEPTLLDLVDYVAEWSADAPILLVCLGRPELLQDRPGWADDALVLGPLERHEARALVEALPERESIADEAVDAVLAAAEGNPLFLEQLTTFAADGELHEGAVPPTVEVLLASRLDRLGHAERSVLEWSAVVGSDFTRDAVEELAGHDERAIVAPTLLELVRRRLVRPVRSTVPNEDAFRFQHVLVRDVAYGGILKAVRAQLHERLARWLDARGGAREEIVGFHFEQAYRFGSELGEAQAALAREAGERLGEAGIRALKRYDWSAASNLLGRATRLLPTAGARRLELCCELGLALKAGGSSDAAEDLLNQVAAVASESGQHHLELRARIEQAWPRLLRGDATAEEILAVLDDGVATFEQIGDERGLARAWQLVAAVRGGFQGRRTESEKAAEQALQYYRRTGFAARGCLMLLGAAVYYGPCPVSEAIVRIESLLADDTVDRASRADLRTYSGCLRALQGSFDEARDRLGEAHTTYVELGESVHLPTDWTHVAATVELLAGRLDEAERILVGACGALSERGERAWRATHTAVLAEIALSRGRVDDSLRLSSDAMQIAPEDDLTAQVLWRCARAKALARAGDPVTGERLARETLDLLEASDELHAKGLAYRSLGEVLCLAGRTVEAAGVLAIAASVYDAKGSVVLADRALKQLNELRAGTHKP